MPVKLIKSITYTLLCVSSLVPAVAWSTPDLDDFNLVFSDEFNGSTLDASKWNTSFLWGPYLPINNEEQLYVDQLGINANCLLYTSDAADE